MITEKTIKEAKAIRDLVLLLDVKDNYAVTGSWALARMGLFPDKRVKDVDLVIFTPTVENQAKLKALKESLPDIDESSSANRQRTCAFKYQDVSFDIFFEIKMDEEVLKLKQGDLLGITIRSFPKIKEAKLKLARPKDYIQLRNIAKSIMSAAEFDNYMDNQ